MQPSLVEHTPNGMPCIATVDEDEEHNEQVSDTESLSGLVVGTVVPAVRQEPTSEDVRIQETALPKLINGAGRK